jgi:DNA topoisomerase-1
MPVKKIPIKPKTFKTKTFTTKTLSKNTFAEYLIIVESPSKCAKIEEYLGNKYQCISSLGHIRELGSLKAIDIENNYTPTFSIIADKKAHIQEMSNIINEFPKSNIIIATDDDREGEAIGAHICAVFGLSVESTPRIIFHEITPIALKKSIQNLGRINMNIVHAQYARQIVDVLVGFRISPLLWKHIFHNNKNGLSAGRCQTPALRLIYENEQVTKTTIPEYKYKISGKFINMNIVEPIVFSLNKTFIVNTEVEGFLELSKTYSHILSIGEKKESRRSPPKPFNTSRLLQTASNNLHSSPSKTMESCQRLYQGGHITYMRTENTKYSAEFLDVARKYILDKHNNNEKYLGEMDILESTPNLFPHEAIRVTHLNTTMIDAKDNSLYQLIWRNTIESCMSDAIYNTYLLSITAPLAAVYKYTLEIPVFLGWNYISKSNTADVAKQSSFLMSIQELIKTEKPIKYAQIESSLAVSNLSHRYTEASLIQKMEDLSIGRPSTFSSIISIIQDRGYVLKTDVLGESVKCIDYILRQSVIEKKEIEKTFGNEKDKMVIQPIGELCVDFLTTHFTEIFDYGYTKKMEEDLDEISVSAKVSWPDLCMKYDTKIQELSKIISNIKKQVFAIDSDHELCFSKYGTAVKQISTKKYFSVNKDLKIDMILLKNGGYTLNELLVNNGTSINSLGKHKDIDIYVKSGPYGAYLEWGETKKTLKNTEFTDGLNVTLVNAIEILDSEQTGNDKTEKFVLRVISEKCSIRRGKYGMYVHYTDTGKSPQFFSLKKFKGDYTTCEPSILINWVNTTFSPIKIT